MEQPQYLGWDEIMAISRTYATPSGNGGTWERISGTPAEVLAELNSKGVRPQDIDIIADDCTSCVFRK